MHLAILDLRNFKFPARCGKHSYTRIVAANLLVALLFATYGGIISTSEADAQTVYNRNSKPIFLNRQAREIQRRNAEKRRRQAEQRRRAQDQERRLRAERQRANLNALRQKRINENKQAEAKRRQAQRQTDDRRFEEARRISNRLLWLKKQERAQYAARQAFIRKMQIEKENQERRLNMQKKVGLLQWRKRKEQERQRQLLQQTNRALLEARIRQNKS